MADLTRIKKLVNMELGTTDSYTEVTNDPRYYEQGLTDIILDIDYQIAAAICGNPAHPRRSGFISTTNVPYGGVIPTKLGPIESVTIAGRPATWASKDKIDSDVRNVLNLDASLFKPLYNIENNNTIFHNATNALFGATVAVVSYPNVVRGSVCVSPDEYEHAIACGALAFLFPFMGADVSAAGLYDGIYWKYVRLIVSGELVIPELQVMKEAAAVQ